MVTGPSVDRHHLVPKLKGGKEAERIHRVCHTKIHSLWSENELRDTYHEWEVIRADERIQSFIRWIAKKPPEFMDTNRRVKGHQKKRRR